MKANEQYVTIKEFADMADVTPQTIYKRLNNKKDNQFKKNLKIENGKKLININALKQFKKDDDFKSVEHFLNKGLTTNLNETLSILNEQLKAKDKQIEELTKILSESQKLNENNQILLKQSQEKVLKLEAPREKKIWFKRR